MYFKRDLEPLLKIALKSFSATILTGARQAGKTTLLKHILKGKHAYVLLDELDKRTFAQADPNGFLERYPPPVVIDEIQNAPSLIPTIKARIDENPKKGQWVLTGSQKFSLMKNISESLAGRAAVLNLHPFSITEIFKKRIEAVHTLEDYVDLVFDSTKSVSPSGPDLGEWLLRGCYPALWEDKTIPVSLWYSSYIQTYLDRDVRGNIKEANLTEFQRFLKLLASRTSLELNMAGLSRELGLTIPTIKAWISLLEASSLIMLLPPYHKNFGKRVVKAPKVFFLDTGLVCYLVGLQTAEHLLNSPMAGALFETAVVANFKKVIDSLGMPESMYYWRAIGGLEVDLLVDLAGELIPIEIKLTSTMTPNHYTNLVAWRNLSQSKQKGLVISQSKENGLVGPNIINSHWTSL